jgi:DNA polymerase III subunit alpha
LEKEVLGQFVTDHPLLEVKEVLAAQTDMELSEVGGLGDGDVVTVAGIVGFMTRKFTKKGEPFAQLRLEDLTGGVIVVAFPNVYERVPELIETDAIVLVKGRADLRGRELQLRALEIREPDLGIERQTPPDHLLVVDVPAASCTNAVIAKLRELLGAHAGRTPVQVRFLSSRGVTPLDVGTYRVDPNAGVLSELRALLGAEAVKVVPRRDTRVVAVPDLVVR